MNQNPPLVSVIIPTYNRPDLVRETIDSVLKQTYSNLEIIVVDDGSSTPTEKNLDDFIQKQKISFVRQQNGGQATARNKGAELASGEYITFIDDDDLWYPNNIKTLVDLLDSTPNAVLACGLHKKFDRIESGWESNLVDEKVLSEHRLPTGNVYNEMLKAGWIKTPGQALIRKSAFEQVKGFDISIKGTEDWELYIRLSLLGSFLVSQHLAVHYRVHSGNISGKIFYMYEEVRKVQRKHWTTRMIVTHPILYIKSRKLQTKRLQVEFQKTLDSYLASGNRNAFEALTSQAKRKHPYLLIFPSYRRSKAKAKINFGAAEEINA